jgi:hypothetical protein
MAVVDSPLTMPSKKFAGDDAKAHLANAKAVEDFAISIYTQLVPVGSVLMYGGGTAPTGWLLCNGQAVSRTTYISLFTVIGTSYGVGDGSTTFNVPDLQATGATAMRAPVGAGTGISIGSLNNASDVAGTVLKGVAFFFIIRSG